MSEEELARAKELYMEYIPVVEIARRLKLGRSSLQYYVNKTWRAEREIFSTSLLSEIADNKRAQITQVAATSIDLIIKALGDLGKKDTLTAFDANTLCNVYEKLDKILKLDAGNPTDIIANQKPATIIEIRKRLAADPLSIGMEDAQIVQEDLDEENNGDDDCININAIRTSSRNSKPEKSEEDSSN